KETKWPAWQRVPRRKPLLSKKNIKGSSLILPENILMIPKTFGKILGLTRQKLNFFEGVCKVYLNYERQK
ncbi:hypothetical protein L3Q82_024260, partial [Scortum barcoo]